MTHPNKFCQQLRQILYQEQKAPKFRVPGILALLGILIMGCTTSKDLSTKPLYAIDKFKIEDNIERTVFIEQLILAKVPDPANPMVVTLEKYIRFGRAVYAINVHAVGADLPDRDEIILMIDEQIIALTAAGPSRIFQSGDTEMESVGFFLDEDTFKGLRYCEALEIHYDQYAIPIPQDGLGAIWNFLKE